MFFQRTSSLPRPRHTPPTVPTYNIHTSTYGARQTDQPGFRRLPRVLFSASQLCPGPTSILLRLEPCWKPAGARIAGTGGVALCIRPAGCARHTINTQCYSAGTAGVSMYWCVGCLVSSLSRSLSMSDSFPGCLATFLIRQRVDRRCRRGASKTSSASAFDLIRDCESWLSMLDCRHRSRTHHGQAPTGIHHVPNQPIIDASVVGQNPSRYQSHPSQQTLGILLPALVQRRRSC
ncbi:hypothetical protein B0I35DRAFT_209956 [Stachybotrys elegans]|uniref:Uncharacterized protein n=1 Tax=Stachybotrys elegans TaxID=80388 RepID=A0A8K0WTJ3_9HYPO|nr:hypothetical protein B0I35DRAFT_209956 [Stachybotrys elegans]